MVHHPPPPALSVWGTNSAIPSHLAFEFFIVSGPLCKSRSLSLSRFCLSRLQLSLDPLQISTKLSRKKLRTTNSPETSSPSLFLSIGIHPAVCRPYRSYTAQDEGNEWPIIQHLALDRYASAATGRCHPISRWPVSTSPTMHRRLAATLVHRRDYPEKRPYRHCSTSVPRRRGNTG